MWTDGSVALLGLGGFAVVTHEGAALAAGQVPGPFADIYQAKVWAICVAIAATQGPTLRVATDPLSAVKAWQARQQRSNARSPAADLWQAISAAFQSEQGSLELRWIRARQDLHEHQDRDTLSMTVQISQLNGLLSAVQTETKELDIAFYRSSPACAPGPKPS